MHIGLARLWPMGHAIHASLISTSRSLENAFSEAFEFLFILRPFVDRIFRRGARIEGLFADFSLIHMADASQPLAQAQAHVRGLIDKKSLPSIQPGVSVQQYLSLAQNLLQKLPQAADVSDENFIRLHKTVQ